MCDCLHKKNNTSLINKFDGGGAIIHTADGDDCYECALNKFDIDNLDDFEIMQYSHHIKSMAKADALKVLINTVEGDYSQLSPELAELAEKYYPESDYDVEYSDGGSVEDRAKKLVDSLKEKGYTDRIIDYYGVKVRERIQANKGKDKGTYTRYHLALNGDKSTAVRINSYLDEDEVLGLYRRSLEDKFRDGGVIDAKRRFTDNDFSRLTENEFESSRIGDVWSITKVGSTRILGRYNPDKQYIYVLGKKDLTNPLVKWLSENSYTTSDEYYKLENGGGVCEYTKAQKWWGNDLSLNEQKEYAKKHLLNFEYSELMGYPSYSTGERRRKFVEKIWEGEGKPESVISGLYKDGGYIKLTSKEKERLNELQKREDVDILTKSENEEYELLVAKYRMTKEYQSRSKNKFANGGGVGQSITHKELFERMMKNETLDYKYSIIRKWSDNMITDEDIDGILNALVLGGITDSDLHTKPTKTGRQYLKAKEEKTKEIMGVMEKNYTGSLKGNKPYMPIYTMVDRATRFNDNIIERFKAERMGKEGFANGGGVGSHGNSKYWVSYVNELNPNPKRESYFTDDKDEAINFAISVRKGYSKVFENKDNGYNEFVWLIDGIPTYEQDYNDTIPKKYSNGGEVDFVVGNTYQYLLEKNVDIRFKEKNYNGDYIFIDARDLSLIVIPKDRLSSSVAKTTELEMLINDNLHNGEISSEALKQIIGYEPEFPFQYVGSIKLTKCFLRNYYKI